MDYMEDTDWMEQVQDAVGGLLARPPLKRAKPEEDGEDRSDERPKGKGKGRGKGKNKNQDYHQPQTQQLAALQQTVGQLISLTLRHESQLQALASTDQFLLFLPAGPASLMPNILQQTQQWKEQQGKGTSTQPLRVVLGQLVIQEILDRFTKLQTKGNQDPLWQKAIQQLLITPEGLWPYLQWDPTQKKLQVLPNKTPIKGEQIQKALEELLEYMRNPAHLLRFKSFQPPQTSKKTVIPFLLQVSLRDNRLYETLSWLSHNSVWMLVEARLRQHMVRPTQLVTQILKGQGRSA